MITISTIIEAPIDKVWEFWTQSEHITQWNFATNDWHCPEANNELKVGSTFSWRMEAKDGSMGFDFTGTYKEIKAKRKIVFSLSDGRLANVVFSKKKNNTILTESFEPEGTHADEHQRVGWTAILDNFRKYAEAYRLREY